MLQCSNKVATVQDFPIGKMETKTFTMKSTLNSPTILCHSKEILTTSKTILKHKWKNWKDSNNYWVRSAKTARPLDLIRMSLNNLISLQLIRKSTKDSLLLIGQLQANQELRLWRQKHFHSTSTPLTRRSTYSTNTKCQKWTSFPILDFYFRGLFYNYYLKF